MLGIVATTLISAIVGASRGVEDGDPFLDEEVGDHLDEQGGEDQLQVLLHPAQLCLLRLDPDQSFWMPASNILLPLCKNGYELANLRRYV